MKMSRNPNPLPLHARGCDLAAFVNGLDAREADEQSDSGQITDCPYTADTISARSWWRGYNYEQTENPPRQA